MEKDELGEAKYDLVRHADCKNCKNDSMSQFSGQ